MCLRACVCVCVCVCVRARACAHTRVCVCMCVCLCECTYMLEYDFLHVLYHITTSEDTPSIALHCDNIILHHSFL